VRTLVPDLPRLGELDARGVIVTDAAAAGYDFVSRYFAPRMGIPEDAATGSAHCALGPFWGETLARSDLLGYQASARGGYIRVRWLGGDRIEIAGQAVTVAADTLRSTPPC
jgi:predicted PhzF superfamily epimerase YddE/YHI9